VSFEKQSLGFFLSEITPLSPAVLHFLDEVVNNC